MEDIRVFVELVVSGEYNGRPWRKLLGFDGKYHVNLKLYRDCPNLTDFFKWYDLKVQFFRRDDGTYERKVVDFKLSENQSNQTS